MIFSKILRWSPIPERIMRYILSAGHGAGEENRWRGPIPLWERGIKGDLIVEWEGCFATDL